MNAAQQTLETQKKKNRDNILDLSSFTPIANQKPGNKMRFLGRDFSIRRENKDNQPLGGFVDFTETFSGGMNSVTNSISGFARGTSNSINTISKTPKNAVDNMFSSMGGSLVKNIFVIALVIFGLRYFLKKRK
jgi:hypothetical protein